MNCNREDYLVVCNLPYDITMRFGKSGSPEECYLQPMFKKLGSDKCLALLKVVEYGPKKVTVRLPESLACHGEGRYKVEVFDQCCQSCDSVEVWFEADCEIVDVTGKEPEMNCNDC